MAELMPVEPVPPTDEEAAGVTADAIESPATGDTESVKLTLQ